MSEDSVLWRFLYPLLASLAGALAGLAIQSSKDMTLTQVLLFLVAGTGFGFFVFPIVFQGIYNPQIAGAVCFVMSSTWQALLPVIVKKLFGQGDAK